MMKHSRLVLLAAALTLAPTLASAQQPTRRRQAPIEIRGQVPTPQVVTVRPRAVPAYSRQVLVPRFFDRDFWPEIQLGYQMVPERQVSGRAVADSTVGADSLTVMRGMSTSPDSAARRPVAPPSGATLEPRTTPGAPPSVTPDSTRRSPGTAPAP